jgi:hypothetical protein
MSAEMKKWIDPAVILMFYAPGRIEIAYNIRISEPKMQAEDKRCSIISSYQA